MKQKLTTKLFFFLILIGTFCYSQNIKISKLQLTENHDIELIIESSEEFYMGALDYHLYIGTTPLKNPRHETKDSKYYLIYTITGTDFKKLPESATTGLSYGKINIDSATLKSMKNLTSAPGVIPLNNFSKSQLHSNR